MPIEVSQIEKNTLDKTQKENLQKRLVLSQKAIDGEITPEEYFSRSHELLVTWNEEQLKPLALRSLEKMSSEQISEDIRGIFSAYSYAKDWSEETYTGALELGVAYHLERLAEIDPEEATQAALFIEAWNKHEIPEEGTEPYKDFELFKIKRAPTKRRKGNLTKLTLPSDKVSNTLMGGNRYLEDYSGEAWPINVGGNREATLQVTSDYEEKLNPVDRLLLEDIFSVYQEDKEENITFARILEARTGRKIKAKDYRSKIEGIIERVDRLRNIDVTYTETNHAGNTIKLKGHPLNAITVETDNPEQRHLGGVRLIGTIEESMPFFNYALERKQVATMPKKLIPQTISSSDDNAIIYRYLYRHIEKLKNKKNKFSNNVLTFERIHQELRKDPTRVEAKRIRETVEKILNEWLAEGYISAYNFNKKGKAFYSITITK